MEDALNWMFYFEKKKTGFSLLHAIICARMHKAVQRRHSVNVCTSAGLPEVKEAIWHP